jgi:hypothetical protein
MNLSPTVSPLVLLVIVSVGKTTNLLRGYFLGGAQLLPLPWVKDIPRMSALPQAEKTDSKPRMKRSFSLKLVLCSFSSQASLLHFTLQKGEIKLLVDLRNWMQTCSQTSMFALSIVLFFLIFE